MENYERIRDYTIIIVGIGGVGRSVEPTLSRRNNNNNNNNNNDNNKSDEMICLASITNQQRGGRNAYKMRDREIDLV